jgi:hypothetical protein
VTLAAVVVGNLVYVLGAVIGIVIGALVVTLRHRQPSSVEAGMASFRKGLRALAPDREPGSTPAAPPPAAPRQPPPTVGALSPRTGPPATVSPAGRPPAAGGVTASLAARAATGTGAG